MLNLEQRVAALERQQRVSIALNVALILTVGFIVSGTLRRVHAQQKQVVKSLIVSELLVADSRGVIRARLGGDLPDAVIAGKAIPRGNRAAGLLIYDQAGQERGGYVTFEPSGNVALTLDNRSGQTAEFVADPEAGSVLRLHWADDAVELRVDEDGPSLHAVRKKGVAFHEPPVEDPKSTALCKGLLEAKTRMPLTKLFDACRSRSSESACQTCLAK
jgi:hypothetical protein